MSRELIKPLPTQAVALACPAQELLFGGAKGGGKSHFLALCALPLLAHAHKRFVETGRKQEWVRVVLFRKNLSDLADLVIKTQRVMPVFDRDAEWSDQKKKWTFTSGATFQIAHLDGPEDHTAWNGQEICCLLFDQVEEIPYLQYAYIAANLRASDPEYKPFLKIRCTANPGGRHGDWVKARFVDPCPEGGKIISERIKLSDGTHRTVTRAFIRSALKDNPFLHDDGQYEANLRAGLPEHLVKQFLDGDWNVVTGAYFASLMRPVHAIQSFPIPRSWEIRAGLDWGSVAPAAWEIGARDEAGNVYFIDELYCPGDTGRRFGERMFRKLNEQQWSAERKWSINDFYTVFDPQAKAKVGAEGATAAAGIQSWGFRMFEANKDRAAGIEQIRERLRVDADGKPKMYIFKDRCPKLLRQLETAPADTKNPEDYERTAPVHAIDAARFLLMEWALPTWADQNPVDTEIAKWERLLNQQRAANIDDDTMTAGD